MSLFYTVLFIKLYHTCTIKYISEFETRTSTKLYQPNTYPSSNELRENVSNLNQTVKSQLEEHRKTLSILNQTVKYYFKRTLEDFLKLELNGQILLSELKRSLKIINRHRNQGSTYAKSKQIQSELVHPSN